MGEGELGESEIRDRSREWDTRFVRFYEAGLHLLAGF